MGPTGHQLRELLSLRYAPRLRTKDRRVQEKAQQIEVRSAQMVSQREVISPPRVEVFRQGSAARPALHDPRDSGEDGVALDSQF